MDADLLKREYLVAYDYSSGAVWAIVLAQSANEILRRYRQLKVHTSPPEWMSQQELESIRLQGVIDIDGGGVPEWMVLSNDG